MLGAISMPESATDTTVLPLSALFRSATSTVPPSPVKTIALDSELIQTWLKSESEREPSLKSS
jgi:hypothetical protein